MKHLNSTTRIFVVLLIVTLLLTYLALILSRNQQTEDPFSFSQRNTPKDLSTRIDSPKAMVDTRRWPQYKDAKYPLTFSHPKPWAVTTDQNIIKGYHTIVINPPNTPNNIHVFISDDNYTAMEGLEFKPYKIDKADGIKVSETLMGAKAGDNYYTFDGSMNENQYMEFIGLMSTVKFN